MKFYWQIDCDWLKFFRCEQKYVFANFLLDRANEVPHLMLILHRQLRRQQFQLLEN